MASSAKQVEKKELIKDELPVNTSTISNLDVPKQSKKTTNNDGPTEEKTKSASKTSVSVRSSLNSISSSSLKENKKKEPKKGNKLSDLSRTDFSGN